MRSSGRLVLSSSFPRFAGDYAGAFVKRHLDFLAQSKPPTIVCPRDSRTDAAFDDSLPFRVVRFGLPSGLLYGAGGPENISSAGLFVYPKAALACTSMFAAALPYLPRAEGITAHWALPAGLVGMALKKISGLPLQLVLHGGAAQLMLGSLPGRRLLRSILNSADDIVFVSEDLRQRVLKSVALHEREKLFARSRVLPMGVDTADFRRSDGLPAAALETRRLLFLGRLAPIKGVDTLIKALSSIKSDWSLSITGDGPQAAYLKNLSAELGVKAEFCGAVDYRSRAAYFREHPVFVLPSQPLKNGRVEGAPQVLLEAMAAGACIVAADCGGVRELLSGGECGLLYKPGDTSELADLLNKALQNGALRRNLGAKAQSAAAGFDWEKTGRALCATPGRHAK